MTKPALKRYKIQVVIGLALLVLAIGASVPQIVGDGTNKYTGVKLEAARFVLDSFDPFDEGIGTVPGLSRLHVAEVAFTPKNSFEECKDPNSKYSYTVKLDSVWWFGITIPELTRSVCQYSGG